MIRILYLYENLHIGGAEQLLLTTLKYLNHDKFNPVVCCISEKGKIGSEIEKLGVPVRVLNRKVNLWNIRIILDLVKIFKREKPDILHSSLFYPSYFGRITALFTKIPIVIITEHGTHSNFKKFYHHWIDFILSFFTTKVVAVSRAVKEYLLRYALIPEQKIAVIHNAIDFERFNTAFGMDKNLVRQKLGFLESNFLIGCVSNLAPWKGQLILLQAFSRVIRYFPSAKLCIVGRNAASFRQELEAFVQKNKFGESVYFLGERRDTPWILRAFDIFVFPSLTEGLGISLLEAMYMGIPAVASSTEGILEIIENNENGILVPPGDFKELAKEIIILLKDKDKMQRIGCNARKKIEMLFSPKTYIEKLELFYNAS